MKFTQKLLTYLIAGQKLILLFPEVSRGKNITRKYVDSCSLSRQKVKQLMHGYGGKVQILLCNFFSSISCPIMCTHWQRTALGDGEILKLL